MRVHVEDIHARRQAEPGEHVGAVALEHRDHAGADPRLEFPGEKVGMPPARQYLTHPAGPHLRIIVQCIKIDREEPRYLANLDYPLGKISQRHPNLAEHLMLGQQWEDVIAGRQNTRIV